jgi:hypothetical protein
MELRISCLRPRSPENRKAGWRCSSDRAGLLQNSLLTGNFTGNFAKSGLQDGSILQETAVPQPFLSQFPAQNNREKIRKKQGNFLEQQGMKERELSAR